MYILTRVSSLKERGKLWFLCINCSTRVGPEENLIINSPDVLRWHAWWQLEVWSEPLVMTQMRNDILNSNLNVTICVKPALNSWGWYCSTSVMASVEYCLFPWGFHQCDVVLCPPIQSIQGAASILTVTFTKVTELKQCLPCRILVK